MTKQDKMSAKERQTYIMECLQQEKKPITGSVFASETNVSRQVIVQDISILKAKKKPIIATSRGYLLENKDEDTYEKIIAVNHRPEQTEEELYIIVDHGVTVKNVIVEHALYGEITASIMVSNRIEVNEFVKKMDETKAVHLSALTDGVHLHTLVADSMDKIDAACASLAAADILL